MDLFLLAETTASVGNEGKAVTRQTTPEVPKTPTGQKTRVDRQGAPPVAVAVADPGALAALTRATEA